MKTKIRLRETGKNLGLTFKEDVCNFYKLQDGTIFEMEHYRWQEYTGKGADQHNAKEKPVDKDDHMVENLGRCLFNEPRFIEMPRANNSAQPANLDPYA